MKVTHVGIEVKDLEESVKFYMEILGLKEVGRFSRREGVMIVFLKGEGDAMIELLGGMDRSEWKTDSVQGLISHFALEVSDMAASVQALREKGIDLTRGPIEGRGGTTIAFFEDPNGVTIEFIQHGAVL